MTTPRSASRRRLTGPLPTLLLLAAVAALALVGCSGGSEDDAGSTADSGAADSRAVAVPDAAIEADAAEADADQKGSGEKGSPDAARGRPAALEDRRVVRTGTVELRAGDVAAAQRDVQRLVDRHRGEVGEQETTTDDDGEAAYARLVVRVPGDDFSALVEELSSVGTLVAADTAEEDVTTKAIDLETRIKVQRRSIARITLLFDRAEQIRDVMAIESELARRQADLDSLEQQAAYLARQTAMSTITVTIDRRHRAASATPGDGGFTAGLAAGWDALAGFGTGLATVAGALLPWAVALGVVGPPVVLVGRRLRRRISAGRSARTPSAA